LFPETSRAAAYVTTFLAHPAPKVTWRFSTRVFFDIDIDHCANCGGSLKIIAAIGDPPVYIGIDAKANWLVGWSIYCQYTCIAHSHNRIGFILNALDSNWCHRIASARIQVKTYPFISILRELCDGLAELSRRSLGR
jgi:hypothetical protein